MSVVVIALPGNEALAEGLAGPLGGQVGLSMVRRFPDGETYVRLEEAVEGREVALACTLDRPDEKLLGLVFLAKLAREHGALRVGLVAPYLAYMRQDTAFQPGEGVTSRYFAEVVSGAVDWLVTVDPHLHRHGSLGEVYPIPSRVAHAAPLIAGWIGEHVERPVIIGPDSESKQWVAAVAESAGAPYTVLEKVRRGDREVEVSVPEAGRWAGHTPVLVDDIISTAHTMIETVRHLKAGGFPAPVCIGVHGVFVDGAREALGAAGAGRIVTCNTIPHETNEIDVTGVLGEAVLGLIGV